MKYLFLITIYLFFNNLFSQQLKTYSGPYKNGVATYKYYENKSKEKVLNGDFKYISNNIEIIGKFENNKKTGKWKYSRKNYQFNDNDLFFTGTYVNDFKDGAWLFNRYFTNKGKKEQYNSKVSFLKDTLVGLFETPNIKGQFTSTGEFVGKWIYVRDDLETTIEFENNFVTKSSEKSLTDKKSIELYTTEKNFLINLEKNHPNDYSRVSWDIRYLKDDDIYGNKSQNYNRFKLSFEMFNINLLQSMDNIWDTNIFIELGKIRIKKPDYLVIRNKIIVMPDENIYSFESSRLDTKAEFEGGEEKFNRLISNSINLPNDENFLGGKLHFSYTIEKDGTMSNIKFYEDLGYEINNQIEKKLKTCPKWKPALINNKPVRVKHFLFLNIIGNKY